MFLLFKILYKAINLDIFDLYYFAGNESCNLLQNNAAILPRKGVFVRGIAYITHFFQALKSSCFTKKIPKGSVLFFVSTKNQKDSISDLAKSVKKSVIAGEKCELNFYFPLFWAYFWSLPFFPFLCWRYLMAGDYHRKTFSYFADMYLLTYGYYIVGHFWLKKIRPACILTANDHSMQNRVITNISSEINIPSLYLQHASVTEKFPPLNFDFALLEGLDALQKYEKIGGGKTRVFLVGMSKIDSYSAFVNVSPTLKRLGICCNMLDDTTSIEHLCSEITKHFQNITVVLRPHPADKRRFSVWRKIARGFGLEYSDPVVENALAFLTKIDALVAGESNIHLEAALLNVYPLYFDFSGDFLDWYGFVQNGVLEYFADIETLCQKISQLILVKPLVRFRCKPYCETIGTPYEWKSVQLAKELIESIAFGADLKELPWQVVPSAKLQAFKPWY